MINTLELIFQATPTYSLISNNGNNGFCRHAAGGLLSTCAGASSISSIGKCASFCSRKSNCNGFIYASSNGACQLYTSDSTCPNGFRYIARQATSETIFDLVAAPSSTWVCYGKKSGNSVLYYEEYIEVSVIYPQKISKTKRALLFSFKHVTPLWFLVLHQRLPQQPPRFQLLQYGQEVIKGKSK